MNYIQKNLVAIGADRNMTRCLNSVNGTSPVVYECNSPYNYAFYETDSKKFPLQSLRRPEEESQRLVKHWRDECSNRPGVYVLLGLTNMHILAEFMNKLDSNSELLVVEPSPEILKSFLENNDISILKNAAAGFTLLCPFEERVEKLFRKFINSRSGFCRGIFISPSNQRFRKHLLDIKELLRKQVHLEAMDRVTTLKFADEWLQNCLINLPEIVESPGINSFFAKFPQSECFVVCAGPSLNDSLELIRENREKRFIIAVGTALKPLLNAGIEPDMTIVVDSDPKVYRQFEGLEKLPGVLVATHTVFPGIFQLYKNKTVCFNSLVSNCFTEWLSKSGLNQGILNVGGTVALSALDCALKLGFKRTFIFGLDLAFAEDGTSHAKNSMYQGQRIQNDLVEIPGNWKRKVKTTKQFAHYVEIMKGYVQDVLAGQVGKFFNVNNHGAEIAGLQTVKPQDVTELLSETSENCRVHFTNDFKANQTVDISELCEHSLEELKSLNEGCNKFIKELEKGEFTEELISFEQEIKASDIGNTLAAPAMHSYCINLNTQQVNQDPMVMTKNFFIQLAGATEWIEGLLNNSYKRFQNHNKGVQHGT